MTFKRKLLISLGGISAFSPIVAVVACGKIAEPSKEDQEAYAKLTSTQALRVLEEEWAEKALIQAKVFTEADLGDRGASDTDATKKTLFHTLDVTKAGLVRVKETAQYIIRQEIAKDKTYLNKLAINLLSDASATQWDATNAKHAPLDRDYLNKHGLAALYNYGEVKFTSDANGEAGKVSDIALNLLLNYTKSDFRLKVYKQLVAEAYLSLDKASYQKAFPRAVRGLTIRQNKIEDANFVLIDQMLSQKLFAQWNIKLDDTKSKKFIGKTYATSALVKAAMTGSGELAAAAKKSEQKILEQEVMLDSNYTNVVGWKGISTMAAKGQGALSFTDEALELAANDAAWEGALLKDDIVTASATAADIKAIPDTTTGTVITTVDVTYVKGLMPVYVNNKYTLGDWLKAGANKKELIRTLAYKNIDSLYKQATDYFRTKEAADVYLPLDKNSKFYSILKDANFVYVDERTAE